MLAIEGWAIVVEESEEDVRLRNTPSAMVERHMFPRQTNRTETGFEGGCPKDIARESRNAQSLESWGICCAKMSDRWK